MHDEYEKLVREYLRDLDQLQQEMRAEESADFCRSEQGTLLLYALPEDSETRLLWEKVERGEEIERTYTRLLEIAANRINQFLAKETLIYQASVVASVRRRKLSTQEWIRRNIRIGRLPARRIGQGYSVNTRQLLAFLERNAL